MDQLRKLDKNFDRIYSGKKKEWKHQNKLESSHPDYVQLKEEFKQKYLLQYLRYLERQPQGLPLNKSAVSRCYRLSPAIIKKVFLDAAKPRMPREVEVLKKLEKFPHFPK